MEFLQPALFILVPFMIGVAQILKTKYGVPAKYIPVIVLVSCIVLASVYGLVVTDKTGWRFWVDGIVVTGLSHGCVAAFGAMGIFDLIKSAKKEAA